MTGKLNLPRRTTDSAFAFPALGVTTCCLPSHRQDSPLQVRVQVTPQAAFDVDARIKRRLAAGSVPRVSAISGNVAGFKSP